MLSGRTSAPATNVTTYSVTNKVFHCIDGLSNAELNWKINICIVFELFSFGCEGGGYQF